MAEDIRPVTVVRTFPGGHTYTLHFWWRPTRDPECWSGMLVGYPQIVFGRSRLDVMHRGDEMLGTILARHRYIVGTINAEMAAGRFRNVDELNRRTHALRIISVEMVGEPADEGGAT